MVCRPYRSTRIPANQSAHGGGGREATRSALSPTNRDTGIRPARVMAPFPGTLPLAGRTSELDSLVELLRRAGEGPCQVALIEGEAGIGKTRLLAEALDRARGLGFQPFVGTAAELERDRPFGALVEAFDLHPTASDPERAEIGHLLVGDRDPLEGSRLSLAEAPALRFRVLEAVLTLVERLCLSAPVVIAVEDLHWADPSTLLVLRQLCRRLVHLPLALIGTLRTSPRSPELDRLLGEFATHGGLHLLLGSIDPEAVVALVTEVVRTPPGPTLLQAVEGAGGNPLYVTELLRALSSQGAIQVREGRAELPELSLPPSFRLLILRQLESLPADTIEVLRVASILGTSFSLAELSTVLDTPSSALVHKLQDAIRAGVLGEAAERLAFHHELVRQAVYTDLPLSVRRALHLQAGRALAAAEAPPDQVATHLAVGAAPGDQQAIDWLRRAAEVAARRAPSVAVRLLERASELQRPTDPARDQVAAELVALLAWSGRLADAETRARQLLVLGVPADVERTLRVTLAEAMLARGQAGDALQEMEALTPTLPEHDPQRARLLAFAGWTRLFAGDLQGAVALEHEVLAATERERDEAARSVALSGLGIASHLLGDLERAVGLGREAIGSAEQDPTHYLDRYPARLFLGWALQDGDQMAEADRVLREGLRRSEELGLGVHLPYYHARLGALRFVSGEWDDAIAELEAAIQAGEEQQGGALILPRSLLALIAIHRNQLLAAEEALELAEREFAETGSAYGVDVMVWARALLLEARRDALALSILETAWAGGPLSRIPPQLVPIGPDLVRLAVAGGRPELGQAVVEAMDEATAGSPVATWRAAATWCRGLLHGDADALVEAVTTYQQAPRPIERARACEDAAAALSSAGRGEEAAALLGEGVGVYERVGAMLDLNRADAALRTLGIRGGRRGARRRPSRGWESLTPTETEVVRLVTQGLTNVEIGRRLSISRRTVETHLSHIFGKLGVSSRVQLAARASRARPERPPSTS
jgi:DNA-binding CsgD family transcriptional regulator/tetratricopeptide (TPR) repeat protein